MNVTKIQTDLLKDALNKKANSKWFIQVTDNEVLILTPHQIYCLDHKDYILDTAKLIELGVREITTADKMLDNYEQAKPLTKTNVKKLLAGVTCIQLKVGDNVIYVDEALLKNYDKTAEFEGTTGTAPVYIYEGEILVGLVLPVKVV